MVNKCWDKAKRDLSVLLQSLGRSFLWKVNYRFEERGTKHDFPFELHSAVQFWFRCNFISRRSERLVRAFLECYNISSNWFLLSSSNPETWDVKREKNDQFQMQKVFLYRIECFTIFIPYVCMFLTTFLLRASFLSFPQQKRFPHLISRSSYAWLNKLRSESRARISESRFSDCKNIRFTISFCRGTFTYKSRWKIDISPPQRVRRGSSETSNIIPHLASESHISQ